MLLYSWRFHVHDAASSYFVLILANPHSRVLSRQRPSPALTHCNIPVSLSDGISGSGPRAIQHASANTGLHGCGRGACTLAATTSTSVTLDPTLESRANAASTPGRCGVTSPVHVPLIRSNAIDIALNKPVRTRACTAAAGMRSL